MGYVDLLLDGDGRFRLESAPVVICDCRAVEDEPLSGMRVVLRPSQFPDLQEASKPCSTIQSVRGQCSVCGTFYIIDKEGVQVVPGEAREALDIATAP
jgi:hypothetical protein